MCTISVRNLLQQVVDEYVRADKMFTAFDVTMEARRRTQENVRHWEAKKEVHALMNPHVNAGTYNSTIADLGMNPNPILYYPPGSDPSNFVSGGQKAPVVAVSTTDDDDDSDDDGVNCQAPLGSPDCRGRICVPAAFVRQIGLSCGGLAYVYPENERVDIYKSPRLLGGGHSYTVDKDDNIRISQCTLDKAKLGGKTCEFVVTTDKIVLQKR